MNANEDTDDVSSLPSQPPTTTTTTTTTDSVEYSRTVSQNLRHLDDALTHAIDQSTIFNNETMSDLSLKYELMRNNEVMILKDNYLNRFFLSLYHLESSYWFFCSIITIITITEK